MYHSWRIRFKSDKTFFSWRTESRVDVIKNDTVSLLAESGLEVIDLGLESASHKQLIKMGKQNKPDVYLTRASELLKKCHEYKIKTKINVMLYAGENQQTVDETVKWLSEHKDYIFGLSVGVVSAFGWDKNKTNYIQDLQSLGATICKEKSIVGVTNFHLSSDISHAESICITKEISENFMSLENYFYLKSFSYYPRNYKKEQFLSDISREKTNFSI